MSTTTAEAFEQYRPLLFSITYRMLGSVSQAEDIVQETFLRYHRAQRDGVDIASPKAYLVAVATRASIDHLRSAQTRRETYVGEWLPEPLITDGSVAAPTTDPAEHAEQADSLSMAFLVLLEALSPLERAVFLLHDVFSYRYDEIAGIVDRNEVACRQLASRARQRVTEGKPRFATSRRQRNELAARFFQAVGDGDMDDLVGMLAADVVVYGDSGGISPSWPRPIVGRDNVSRLLLALAQQVRQAGATIAQTEVNGQPGAMMRDGQGRLVNVWSLDIVDGVVQTIRSVINPEKLEHLGPLADLDELRRTARGVRWTPASHGG
jgi:RNA polymerase sigma-70 factor (ECF subfamily)